MDTQEIWRSELIMGIQQHFSRIAPQYRTLRTTDLEPIRSIQKRLTGLHHIIAADVGCGAGRYDIELFEYLGDALHLTCIDQNESMLDELARNLKGHKIEEFKTIKAPAEELPLPADSLDSLLTFNAIHHFHLAGFLQEAGRVLKNQGLLFIYTRLRSQNERNIWGRYFPQFHHKERRLYEFNELQAMIQETPPLALAATENFSYKRTAELTWLLRQAEGHHYSTFHLYDQEEFAEALKGFREKLKRDFADPDRITWDDENIMLVVRKNPQ